MQGLLKKAVFTLLLLSLAPVAAHANAASCWLSYQGDDCRTCCSNGYDTCHEYADFQLFGDPCIPYYLICLDGCKDAQQASTIKPTGSCIDPNGGKCSTNGAGVEPGH